MQIKNSFHFLERPCSVFDIVIFLYSNHTLNHLSYNDITNVSRRGRAYIWIHLLNCKSFLHETWSTAWAVSSQNSLHGLRQWFLNPGSFLFFNLPQLMKNQFWWVYLLKVFYSFEGMQWVNWKLEKQQPSSTKNQEIAYYILSKSQK